MYSLRKEFTSLLSNSITAYVPQTKEGAFWGQTVGHVTITKVTKQFHPIRAKQRTYIIDTVHLTVVQYTPHDNVSIDYWEVGLPIPRCRIAF